MLFSQENAQVLHPYERTDYTTYNQVPRQDNLMVFICRTSQAGSAWSFRRVTWSIGVLDAPCIFPDPP